ncbi:MAG TPA: DUF3618 domain-containing protein [Micromonospora sp.]
MSADGTGNRDALRAQIRQTRAELGETVQALAEKADVKARLRTSAHRTWQRVRGQASHAGHQARGGHSRWRLPLIVAAVGAAAVVVVFVRRRRRR